MITPAKLFGLEQSHLLSTKDGHLLLEQTLIDFELLHQQGKAYGLDITIASSFRSFERQLTIWNNKFHGQRPTFDKSGQQLDMSKLDDWQKVQAILQYSAMPGTSRHHWGTDLDVYDKAAISKDYKLQLEPHEYEKEGPFSAMTSWLSANMKAFNFYRPYVQDLGGVAPELWHLSHRPEALAYSNLFASNAPSLLTILEQHEIAGFKAISQNLDYILNNYVYSVPDK